MITEAKIKNAFNNQINKLIVFILVAEILFYGIHVFFKETGRMESEILTYVLYHVFITIGAMFHFMRNALIEILVVKSENEK